MLRELRRALTRRFSLWAVYALLLGMGTGVVLDMPRLQTWFLMWRLAGSGQMSDGRLKALLDRCGFDRYPRLVELLSAESRYRAQWTWVSTTRKVLCCEVIAKTKPGGRIVGSLSYVFLFDEDGDLLLSGYDSGMLRFADVDLDGVREKVISAHAESRPLGARHLDDKLEVHRLTEDGSICMFRALYALWGRDEGPGEFISPRIDYDADGGYPRILLELQRDDSTEVLAEFRWDPRAARVSGPPGGPGKAWQVEFSRSVPKARRVRAARDVVLPRFLVVGLVVSFLLIAVGWVLQAVGGGDEAKPGLRARLLVMLGLTGAVALAAVVLWAVFLRPSVVVKGWVQHSELLSLESVPPVAELNEVFESPGFVQRLAAACGEPDLTATWTTQYTGARLFRLPNGEVEVYYWFPAYAAREFSWRELTLRYRVGDSSPLAQEADQRNQRLIRQALEAIKATLAEAARIGNPLAGDSP